MKCRNKIRPHRIKAVPSVISAQIEGPRVGCEGHHRAEWRLRNSCLDDEDASWNDNVGPHHFGLTFTTHATLQTVFLPQHSMLIHLPDPPHSRFVIFGDRIDYLRELNRQPRVLVCTKPPGSVFTCFRNCCGRNQTSTCTKGRPHTRLYRNNHPVNHGPSRDKVQKLWPHRRRPLRQ